MRERVNAGRPGPSALCSRLSSQRPTLSPPRAPRAPLRLRTCRSRPGPPFAASRPSPPHPSAPAPSRPLRAPSPASRLLRSAVPQPLSTCAGHPVPWTVSSSSDAGCVPPAPLSRGPAQEPGCAGASVRAPATGGGRACWVRPGVSRHRLALLQGLRGGSEGPSCFAEPSLWPRGPPVPSATQRQRREEPGKSSRPGLPSVRTKALIISFRATSRVGDVPNS